MPNKIALGNIAKLDRTCFSFSFSDSAQGNHLKNAHTRAHTHSHTHTHTGTEINRVKKNFVESQSRRSSQLRGLSDELHGVNRIMFENIDAVIQRGERISGQSLVNLFNGKTNLK